MARTPSFVRQYFSQKNTTDEDSTPTATSVESTASALPPTASAITPAESFSNQRQHPLIQWRQPLRQRRNSLRQRRRITKPGVDRRRRAHPGSTRPKQAYAKGVISFLDSTPCPASMKRHKPFIAILLRVKRHETRIEQEATKLTKRRQFFSRLCFRNHLPGGSEAEDRSRLEGLIFKQERKFGLLLLR